MTTKLKIKKTVMISTRRKYGYVVTVPTSLGKELIDEQHIKKMDVEIYEGNSMKFTPIDCIIIVYTLLGIYDIYLRVYG